MTTKIIQITSDIEKPIKRTFRFRAWDRVEKKIVFVYKIDISHPSGMEVNGSNVSLPGTLMEFANCWDKNGTPIFEGDIVMRYTEDTRTGNYYPVRNKKIDGVRIRVVKWVSDWNGWNITKSKHSEIIGNIYEGIWENKK
jgi:hypothetical protein